MNVKIGSTKFGIIVGQCEYGYIVSLENDEIVYARGKTELDLHDEVMITFKSFSVGCYWEIEELAI